MEKITLVLNDYNLIKKFSHVVSSFRSDIDVKRGRYVVDAKSFIALLTMDLSQPIDVILHSDDEEEIKRFHENMEVFK